MNKCNACLRDETCMYPLITWIVSAIITVLLFFCGNSLYEDYRKEMNYVGTREIVNDFATETFTCYSHSNCIHSFFYEYHHTAYIECNSVYYMTINVPSECGIWDGQKYTMICHTYAGICKKTTYHTYFLAGDAKIPVRTLTTNCEINDLQCFSSISSDSVNYLLETIYYDPNNPNKFVNGTPGKGSAIFVYIICLLATILTLVSFIVWIYDILRILCSGYEPIDHSGYYPTAPEWNYATNNYVNVS